MIGYYFLTCYKNKRILISFCFSKYISFRFFRYWADFDRDYFAKGTYRYAFRGTVHGDGPRDGELCVTKVFKKQYAKYFDKWKPDVAASQKANGFAKLFTREFMRQLGDTVAEYEIEFVIPLIARMDQLSHFKVLGLFSVDHDTAYVQPSEYVAIEPYLYGSFEKFNSNAGYEDGTSPLLTAFSHWTWHATGHRILVCDLQGVKNGPKYLLTDPCIHSIERKYGMTDLGVVGMEKVMSTHKCNDFCRRLGLKNPLEGVRAGKYRQTTYAFAMDDDEVFRMQEARTHYFGLEEPDVLHE